MKAAILRRQNEPLLVEDVFIQRLEYGQVLVEVHASGICGAQLGEISGAGGEDPHLPHLLGHEGAGIVKRVGVGVTHVEEGDHVVMHWRKGVGIESDFPEYYDKTGKENIGGGKVTTFSEQAVVSENRLTPINEDVPFNVAALLGCAVTTGLGLINNEAQLKFGQSIAVAGVGGVGLNIIQGARMANASRIIAMDIHEYRLKLAHKFGANELLNSKKDEVIEGDGVDVFVDCTGIPEVINEGLKCIVPGGKMILVGQPQHMVEVRLDLFREHYCGKTILDSQGGLTNPTVDIPRYIMLWRQRKLRLEELITHTFPLEKINAAIKAMKGGQTGRCILEINS